jgi:hypothetical protein
VAVTADDLEHGRVGVPAAGIDVDDDAPGIPPVDPDAGIADAQRAPHPIVLRVGRAGGRGDDDVGPETELVPRNRGQCAQVGDGRGGDQRDRQGVEHPAVEPHEPDPVAHFVGEARIGQVIDLAARRLHLHR